MKGHVEQLSNLGGSELVAQFKGLSVDHIEYLDLNGIQALKRSGTVAVLLPGAFYFLRETKLPPLTYYVNTKSLSPFPLTLIRALARLPHCVW